MDTLRRMGIPVVLTTIGIAALTFLIAFFGQAPLVGLALTPGQPWGIVTYPFSSSGNGMAILWFAIAMYMLYQFGGLLERRHGTLRFGLAFAGAVVLGGLLSWMFGMLPKGGPVNLAGMGLPLLILAAWWGMENRTARILLWGIIPISGLIVAIGALLWAFFGFGAAAPLQGLAAVIPVGLAAWVGNAGLPGPSRAALDRRPTKAQLLREAQENAEVARRRQKREEDERLRKLFGE